MDEGRDIKLLRVAKEAMVDVLAGRLLVDLPDHAEILEVAYSVELRAFIMQVRHESFNEPRMLNGLFPSHPCVFIHATTRNAVHTRSLPKQTTKYR